MEMKVPYVIFPHQIAKIRPALMQACQSVLDSGVYVLGERLKAFERQFAGFCEAEHGVGVSNGTMALFLAMRSMDIGPGDEVITAPNSFIASAGSIAVLGAKPVFIDVSEDLNIDPDKIEAAISPETKAIMPVHLTGRPAKMDKISEIARAHGLKIIEDAAQAVGARYQGKSIGSWGDATCFSLHPLKNLHAFGDGGVITTNDQQVFERILKARNHGLRNRNECDFWSLNSRLDEIQAAFLSVQLPFLETFTMERRRRALRYNALLKHLVDVPHEADGEYCVWQTYVIKSNHRDALLGFLQERGVQANVHYPLPLHVQSPAKAYGYLEDDFPTAMALSKRILSLPLYPEMTDEQQDFVVESIEDFYRSA